MEVRRLTITLDEEVYTALAETARAEYANLSIPTVARLLLSKLLCPTDRKE